MGMLIEKDIEPPKTMIRRMSKYSFELFEVGDSIAIHPNASTQDITSMKRAAWSYGRTHGKKFEVGLDKNGALRCWRMK